jgi:Asp-tRNA(Asn)/Glu-tRNA(Gln) amidotransferase A subunit family amidase
MSATTTHLWRMSATDLAEAIRSRHISSQEVVEAHLRRIAEVNPSINAVTVVLAEIVRGLRMTIAINALGLPAVALPVGIGDGLLQAVQVIGPRYREDLCLDAAEALEDRVGIITPIDPR